MRVIRSRYWVLTIVLLVGQVDRLSLPHLVWFCDDSAHGWSCEGRFATQLSKSLSTSRMFVSLTMNALDIPLVAVSARLVGYTLRTILARMRRSFVCAL